MENRLGQQFGEYRLSELKGRGASGDVYVGTSLDGSKQAAVKILKEPLTSMQDVQAFLSEARVFLRFNNDAYIVHLLEGTCLPLPTIVRYVKQAATALQNIHKQGFVHRDVKPDNILLNEHDEILLSDFGITIPSFTKKPEPQAPIGTCPYMAPEQFKGEAQSASDQYALAVLAYEWLCGAPPFTGRTCEDLAVQHIMMPPPLHEKVPTIAPQVEQVVLKALAKDPQQRFPSIEAFSTALEQALLPPRKIALFGYETGGGRNAVLWNNPQAFFSDEQYASGYAAWSKTKRSFTGDEVLDGVWIKASDSGNYYQVRFHSDGSLTESALLDPSTQWEGSWKPLDGVLRVNIGWYELDIFANAEGFRHSGIEFYQNEETPCAYFTILHVPGWNKKRWDDMYQVVDLVHCMYGQVFGRRADESGLITYGAMLYRGEKSVREIVKILGLSPEYREQFHHAFR